MSSKVKSACPAVTGVTASITELASAAPSAEASILGQSLSSHVSRHVFLHFLLMHLLSFFLGQDFSSCFSLQSRFCSSKSLVPAAIVAAASSA